MITKVQKYLFNKLPVKLYKHIVIDLKTGCWLWQANINGRGYGRVSISKNNKRKRLAAHVYIYKFFNGEYREGLVLDHVYCKDRNCCNPSHLSPITQKQNIHRGNAILFKKAKLKLPVEPEPYLEDLLEAYCYVR